MNKWSLFGSLSGQLGVCSWWSQRMVWRERYSRISPFHCPSNVRKLAVKPWLESSTTRKVLKWLAHFLDKILGYQAHFHLLNQVIFDSKWKQTNKYCLKTLFYEQIQEFRIVSERYATTVKLSWSTILFDSGIHLCWHDWNRISV